MPREQSRTMNASGWQVNHDLPIDDFIDLMRIDATVPVPPSPDAIIGDCLRKMTLPALDELEEGSKSCMICQEGFLSGGSPELPMKLPCGHIAGSQCLLKWLSPLSAAGSNSCPMCRAPVLDAQNVTRLPIGGEVTRLMVPLDLMQTEFGARLSNDTMSSQIHVGEPSYEPDSFQGDEQANGGARFANLFLQLHRQGVRSRAQPEPSAQVQSSNDRDTHSADRQH